MEKIRKTEQEAEQFLGSKPSEPSVGEIDLKEGLADRINFWTKKGLTKKDDKENLLLSVPRKGKINLEAPTLNEEIAVDLHPKALAKDKHFQDHQNLAGAALSATSSALSLILEGPMQENREQVLMKLSTATKLLSELFYDLTQTRKAFLVGRYEEKVQKILKNAEPTEWLFGDNLKGAIESAKALERASRELKYKPRPPLKPNQNALNTNGSFGKRGAGQASHYYPQQGRSTSRPSDSSNKRRDRADNRPKPYPARKYYTQTQPSQSRR